MFGSALWDGLTRRRRRRLRSEAEALYAVLVHQTRQPAFYRIWGVPDSFDGRFDLLALHAYLVLRRLKGPEGQDLGQALFDAMFADMDDVLREQGVGDLSIGKKIRGMAEAFYGRVKAYDEAFADEGALAAALARNVWRGAVPPEAAAPLARYVKAADEALISADVADLHAGRIRFPPLPQDEARA